MQEISRSFANTISYGNSVVEQYLQPGVSFSQDSWDTIDFYWKDQITGTFVAGSYTFDASGVIQEYSFLTENDYSGYSWFAGIDLNGGFNDFGNHAYNLGVATENPNFQGYVLEAVASGYGQGLANVLDSFPGADPYDQFSTGVRAGSFGFGEFYFA